MRYLTIVRHAKADDPANWDSDFDRPLVERGQKDAHVTAKLLANLQPPIDAWLCSPAQRTRQTMDILAEVLDASLADDDQPVTNDAVQYLDEVYLASLDILIDVLRSAPIEAEHIVILGHNPGLEELAAALCAGDARHFNFRLPTAAFAHMRLQIAHWEQVRAGCGELRYLFAPKLFKK